MAQIIWAVSARNHLNEIAEYIAERSPANAERVVVRVMQTADKLADFPGAGHAVPESDDAVDRQIICRPFRILYRINDEGDVTITAVVHGARDLRIGPPPGPDDLVFDDE